VVRNDTSLKKIEIFKLKNKMTNNDEKHLSQILDNNLCITTTKKDTKSLQYKEKPFFTKQSKGIKTICQLLNKLQVVYSTEVHFGAMCHHWRPLPFDVMVVIKGKIGLIEYDGLQHFQKCDFTKTKEDLINQQTKDLIKTIFTKKHFISLLRISFDTNEEKIQKHLIEYLEFLNTQSSPVYIFSNHELYNEHVKICFST
jgi:hypothetical protein